MLKLQLKVTSLVVWEEGKHFMIKDIFFSIFMSFQLDLDPNKKDLISVGGADKQRLLRIQDTHAL